MGLVKCHLSFWRTEFQRCVDPMSIEAILVPHKDDLVCFFSFNLSPGSVFYARPPPLYVHTCDFLTKKPFLNTCISVLTVHYQNPSFGHESNNNFKDGLLLRYQSLHKSPFQPCRLSFSWKFLFLWSPENFSTIACHQIVP